MVQGTLALDSRLLCRLQRQKSAHSHRCSLKMSDNGPYFIRLGFAEFTRRNDIKHKLVRLYHQASNFQAESAVKIDKSGLRRMSGGTLETKLSWFLFSNRTTPHTTIRVTPADEKEVTDKSGQVVAIHFYHCTPQPRSSENPSFTPQTILPRQSKYHNQLLRCQPHRDDPLEKSGHPNVLVLDKVWI